MSPLSTLKDFVEERGAERMYARTIPAGLVDCAHLIEGTVSAGLLDCAHLLMVGWEDHETPT